MYTLINGSPKVNFSNSIYFLNLISKNLDNFEIFNLKKDQYDNILSSIGNSDTIVLAFPLYADSPNSITLSFLDYIIDNNIDIGGKKLYVIINCGFKEGRQNIVAANIIKRWCNKVGLVYKGSLLIGAGEVVGKKRYSFISRTALKNIDDFGKHIKNNEQSEIITTTDLGAKLYCFLGNLSWNKQARKNHLTIEDIKKK